MTETLQPSDGKIERQMSVRLLACRSLGVGGLSLMAIGFYFPFLRPSILPEDTRYVGASLEQIQRAAPGLLPWLARVFGVLGGFMLGLSLLTVYVAATEFRISSRRTAEIVAFSGLASTGWMAITNFVINSDFKWLLVALTLPWLIALALFAVAQSTVEP